MRSYLKAFLPIVFLLLASVLHAAPSAAQAAAESLRGTYVRDVEASDQMDRIVADGMGKLGRIYRAPIIRGQARKRLQETNRPSATIQIAFQGDNVNVRTETYDLTTPRNGTRENWERAPGDLIDVTSRYQSGRLEQSFDAEDGRRVNVYTLSPDGNTLNLDVTVTSPKLDSPLTYRMVYRRRN